MQQDWGVREENFKKHLYDQHIISDVRAFKKWDGNLQFEGQELLEKDLVRTRMNEEYFTKESTQNVLRRITTFYCKNNHIYYQQGLMEVVLPFALLRRKDFQTRKCFAYFNSFMRNYFPKMLIQKILKGKKELPFTMAAITMTQVLLRYHYPQIYSILQENEIPMSMIVTQELMTIFIKSLPIPLVYELLDFYISKKNQNYLLYICVAMMGIKEEEIKQQSKTDSLHTFMNKGLKDIKDSASLQKWLALSVTLHNSTVKSFQAFTRTLGFNQHGCLTLENIEKIISIENGLIDYFMPIYEDEIKLQPQRYLIVVCGNAGTLKGEFLRLSDEFSPEQNRARVIQVSAGREVVVACSRSNFAAERNYMASVMGHVGMCRVLMLQMMLQEQRSCTIY